jgi:hypothetical protein
VFCNLKLQGKPAQLIETRRQSCHVRHLLTGRNKRGGHCVTTHDSQRRRNPTAKMGYRVDEASRLVRVGRRSGLAWLQPSIPGRGTGASLRLGLGSCPPAGAPCGLHGRQQLQGLIFHEPIEIGKRALAVGGIAVPLVPHRWLQGR